MSKAPERAGEVSTSPARRRKSSESAADVGRGLDQMIECILELNIPPDHRFCVLGGRNGNMVVQVPGGHNAKVLVEMDAPIESRVLIQKGWKVVAFEGRRADGPTIARAVNEAKQEDRECLVAFEVDKETTRALGRSVFQAALSRFQLRELLGNRSLQELSLLSPEEKMNILKEPRVASLLTDAAAVLEMEVLLSYKNAGVVQLTKDIFKITKRGQAAALETLLEDPEIRDGALEEALMQRDGGGNVALHHASDLRIAQMLLSAHPETKRVHNLKSQLPIHTFLMRNAEEAGAIDILADGVEDLLELDSDGISAAMRTRGVARARVESAVSSWDNVRAALESRSLSDVLPALEGLRPEGHGNNLLAYHFFGEHQVWQMGKHTKQSESRLKVFWDCASRFFRAAEGRDSSAPRALRELLRATKGPKPPEDLLRKGADFDARGPYREQVLRRACRLQQLSREVLDKAYEAMQGEDAEWVKSMDNHIADDIREDPEITNLGLRCEDVKGEGVRFRVPLPGWAREVNMQHVFDDLKAVDMLQEFGDRSAVSAMLRLGERDDTFSGFKEADFINVRFFAAWLRGVCNRSQAEVKKTMLDVFGPQAVDGETLFSRKAAKGFPRLCEKLVEFLAELQKKLHEAGMGESDDEDSSAALREIVLRAASFVNDINGCTLVVDSPTDVRAAVDRILEEDGKQEGKLKLRRIKNAFQSKQRSPVGYTDMKLWVEVEGAKLVGFEGAERMLVELQLLLRDFYDEKVFMHLPYEIFRGSLDWPCHAEMLARREQSLMEAAAEERRRELEAEEERLRLELEAEEEARRRRELEEEEERRRLQREREEEEANLAKVEMARKRRALGHVAKHLMEEGFSAMILWSAGFQPRELKDAGIACKELRYMGLTFEQLLKMGFSCRAVMREAPCTIEDLRNTVEVMCEKGFKSNDLIDIGVGADDLKMLEVSAKRMREMGFDAESLLAQDFTVAQLKSAGFSAADLRAAGAKAAALRKAGFTLQSLCEGDFTAEELLEQGASIVDLKEVGFTLTQLKAAGATARDLRGGGFSGTELRSVGFGVKELKNAGCTPGDLRTAGFMGAQISKEGGFSADELRSGGITAGRLRREGFGPRMLKEVGYTVWELAAAGFSVQEITSAGVKLDDLVHAVGQKTEKEATEAGMQPEEFQELAHALGLSEA